MRACWKLLCVVLGVGCWAGSALAQDQVAYLDEDGWHVVEVKEAPFEMSARKDGGTANLVGMFNVAYQDVDEDTGAGFDDPVQGAARRATMNAMFAYLSSLIAAPGTADIMVLKSQSDGGGALATAGPLFHPVRSFQGGYVFDHLTTGDDPHPAVGDAVVTVDFGYLWNSDLDPPESFEFDLFTVLLHEVGHALGFLSLTSANGTSALEAGTFSTYDSYLKRGNGKQLFTAGPTSNATAADLTSGDVFFTGPRAKQTFGADIEVYAPSSWASGSSISHWHLDPFAQTPYDDSVMQPSVAPGVVKREYLDWEVQVLADLGYTTVICGDGTRSGDEECDDGNDNNNDTCRNDCTFPPCGDGVRQPGEQCDNGPGNSDVSPNSCRTDCTFPRCGDGVVDLGEDCDDGNDDDEDGCANTCERLNCGDGEIQEGEICDDGELNSDVAADACRTNCEPASCRDGVLDSGEACDDGNFINTDACTNSCRRAACGDSIVQTGESCDDGNTDSDDGCSSACQLELCGDGILQGDEFCDDGQDNSDTAPNACRADCTAPRCGDGVRDDGEACDDGDDNGDDAVCSSTCELLTCGNGLVDPGELCDDGNNTDGDGCSAVCGVEDGFSCPGAPSRCLRSDTAGLQPGNGACGVGGVPDQTGTLWLLMLGMSMLARRKRK